jgi:TolB-like protein/DNA-binding winged helix-turn-helix (wHTH) protein
VGLHVFYTGSVSTGFSIGDRRVEPSLNRIAGPQGPVQVEPKVMAVLTCLAGRRGEVVSKEELVREVWEGRYVSDDVVWRCIGELRRALGDDARQPVLIETIPKRGYRLKDEKDLKGGGEIHAGAATGRPLIPRGWLAVAFLLGFGALAAVLLVSTRRGGAEHTPQTAGRRMRLAVLPFANLSGDPAQQWFSDGLTDEVISRLGALRPAALGVIGRTSVMSLGRPGEGGADLRQIGRRLGVDYLLEGSVRREGSRVRVSSRLIQTSDQTAVWSDQQDLDLWGALSLQARIADQVAAAVAPQLLPGETPAAAAAAPTTPAAHDAYLEALWFLNRGTPDDLRKSAAAFAKAVALDPRSGRAHAGLADAVHLLALFGAVAPGTAYPRAEAEARRALELDPNLADTRSTLGSILFRYHRDAPAAEAELRRALGINPSSATAHHDYAWLLVSERRFDEALREIRAAQSLEPLSVRANADVGWVWFRARRTGEAIHQMERTLEMEPRFLGARLCLERALALEGRWQDAAAQAREAARREGMPAASLAVLPADPQAVLRRIGEWRLAHLLGARQSGWVSPYALAAQYAELGDADHAVAELDRAFGERDPSLVSADVDPAFDRVRDDPRFAEIVRRIGMPRG